MEPFQEVVHGITRRLREEFQLPVYTEAAEQKPNGSCFLVSTVNGEMSSRLSPRYQVRSACDVRYLPARADKQKECLEISERLFWALEEIPADGLPVRAEKSRFQIVDGTLHFRVEYSFFIQKEAPPLEWMEKVELKEEIG